MRKGLLFSLMLVSACVRNPAIYNGHYEGALKGKCFPAYARAQAMIRNGDAFELILLHGQQVIEGTVSPDGKLTGSGSWVDDQGPVQATFTGEMSGQITGRDFTGRVHDGRCNPYIDLRIDQRK